MKSLTVKAYGKINPTLEILGKKENGLYALDLSWHKISLYDEVTVSLLDVSGHINISCDNAMVPQGSDARKNNCYSAVKELEKFLVQKNPSFKMPGISIHIQKMLPLAGGLGGSATDASATINALLSLLEQTLSIEERNQIATRVGHDCLFLCSDFIHAMGHEKSYEEALLTPLPPISAWLVLVIPQIEIFSGQAYAGLKTNEPLLFSQLNGISNTKKLKDHLFRQASLSMITQYFCNDLERSSATFIAHPILKAIKEKLLEEGCIQAMLSGSGATVFGIAETKEKAEKIQEVLQCRYPQYITNVTALLS